MSAFMLCSKPCMQQLVFCLSPSVLPAQLGRGAGRTATTDLRNSDSEAQGTLHSVENRSHMDSNREPGRMERRPPGRLESLLRPVRNEPELVPWVPDGCCFLWNQQGPSLRAERPR